MINRLAGVASLVFYAGLSWLLPWLYSDNVDEAGGLVILLHRYSPSARARLRFRSSC